MPRKSNITTTEESPKETPYYDPSGWVTKQTRFVVKTIVDHWDMKNLKKDLKLLIKRVTSMTSREVRNFHPDLALFGVQNGLFETNWNSVFVETYRALDECKEEVFRPRKKIGKMKVVPRHVFLKELSTKFVPIAVTHDLALLLTFVERDLREAILWPRDSAVSQKVQRDVILFNGQSNEVSLLGLIVAYAMQSHIPNGNYLSTTYFNPSRTSVRNNLFKRRRVQADKSQRTCELTGKKLTSKGSSMGVFIDPNNGTEIMALWDEAKKQGLKPAFKWEKQNIASIGFPVLGECSCCVLRRPVQTERLSGEDDVPPIPLDTVTDNGEVVSNDIVLGSPIDHNKLTLTVGYKIVQKDRNGSIKYVNTRMCPSCVNVARKAPEDFIRWMDMLDQPWSRKGIESRVKRWKQTWNALEPEVFGDYVTSKDRKDIIDQKADTSDEALAGITKRIEAVKAPLLELHEMMPEVTFGIFEQGKDGSVTLKSNIEEIEGLLDEFGIDYGPEGGGSNV